MVSVNEKYFIERCASENAAKSLRISITPMRSTSDSRLKHQLQNDSNKNKIEDTEDPWEYNSVFEENFPNRNSDLNSSRHSDYVNKSPKKKIIWHQQVIDSINNILNISDLDSSRTSLSPEKKRIITSFHDTSAERVEHYNTSFSSDDWNYSYSSPSSEQSWDNKQPVNRKRLYSQNDDKEVNKRSKVKNFCIPPLDANWKYEKAEYDEIICNIKERAIESEDWVRINQPKISLLGDSHTRHLADIFTEMLRGFKIDASVKPGAKSKRVLSSLKNVLKFMGKNDFVVTLTGTNDMWDESLEEPKSVLYNAVMEAKSTNLLICNIPNNYLEANNSLVQDNIINFNEFYNDIVNFSRSAHLVDIHKLKNRSFYTRHGLHFNLSGKVKICELVSNKILDVIDLLKT